MSKFNRKKDGNHTAIVNDLRKVGVWCCDLSASGGGVPDLLTWFKEKYCFIELKMDKAANITLQQLKFIGECKGDIGFAESFEDAEYLAKNPGTGLTPIQKERIFRYWLKCEIDKVKMVSFKKFKREVGI